MVIKYLIFLNMCGKIHIVRKVKESEWSKGRSLFLCKRRISVANIADVVSSIINDTVAELGFSLWDVRFVKEGADYFLRVFIDSENGIGIDDCVAVSRAIDPLIDEADPIDKSYCLEVCSPGIERDLVKPEHFAKKMGEKVKVKLYKAKDGVKEFIGTLKGYGEAVLIECDGEDLAFTKKEISSVKLADFE